MAPKKVTHSEPETKLSQLNTTIILSDPKGTEAHAHPSHAIRAYTAPTNEDIFSTLYAVRARTDRVPINIIYVPSA